MKAVQFSEYGDPDVLRVVDVEEPHAATGQVRVAVKGAGVNPIDWKIRSGAVREAMPVELPKTPGFEVAGVVDEVGDDVADVAVGDEVFGPAVGGAAAQYALLNHYATKPEALPWPEAAGLPVAVETTVRTFDLLGLESGHTILINGATGGVGLAAVQFALARGARVIGTASEGNHEFLRSLGAEPTTYGDGLVERVRELAPNGVDRALDTAGRGALPDLVEITGNPDHVVTIADFTAAEHGVRITTGAEAWDALDEAARLYAAGSFTMPVAQTFTFEQAPDAHRISQEGHVRGKLVLVPD